MIRFGCPNCGKVYEAEENQASKEVICKKCDSIVLVPANKIREVLYGTTLPSGGIDRPPPKLARPPASPKRKKVRRSAEQDDEPIRTRRGGSKTYVILGICVGAFIAFSACAGIFAIALSTSNALTGGSVTIDNYNSVKVGMTHQEVESLLGPPTVDDRSVGIEMSLWKKDDKTLVSVIFNNNEVIAKSAPGLR